MGFAGGLKAPPRADMIDALLMGSVDNGEGVDDSLRDDG